MSAIFISHSSTDNAWAREIRDWLKGGDRKTEPKRCYDSLFLDFDPEVGIPLGQSWRQTLYSKLELSRAVIVICSPAYCASQWCLAELAIAIDRGKLVLPVRIDPREDHSDLPRLLVETQATRLEPIGLGPGPGSGWEQLERGLEPLSWRERLVWKEGECPFPGLDAFEERQAPVFFGRDAAIAELRERVTSLAGRLPALLLLLGASGYGKSSLVRAGLLPRLKADAQRDWLVLEPFRPGRTPFARLEGVVARARASIGRSALAEPTPEPLRTPEALLTRLDALRPAAQRRDAPFVIVIDQLEELLADTRPASPRAEPSEGERFLALLRDLLDTPLAGVLVIATLRTDALAPLQALRPELVARAHTVTLQPIRRHDYGELISGPAARSGLAAQPGLAERLVSDSGSGDALPLLAFTLEKLWRSRQERGTAVAGPGGQWWDLTIADYEALGGGGEGGVAGVVSQQAREVWEESTSPAEETAALREAFLGHLVRLSEEGLATKQAARWGALPELSKPILERFVAARLLVTGKGEAGDQVEIAHEAMLRTWPTLEGWLEEGREELLQRRRVERLCADLTPERPEPVRRLALDELARLAAAGAGDRRAVELVAASPLEALLRGEGFVIAEREDAALLLALIGAERPLRECLAKREAPVALRRRAAESLGLLASRCGDGERRRALAQELEGWLRSEALDVRIALREDPVQIETARREARRQVVAQLREAFKTSGLKGLSDDQIQEGLQENAELRGQVQAAEEKATLAIRWASGQADGWAEHDARLPLLQGASRGLQLATAADLPVLGSGPGQAVPMLTLTALEEEGGLRVRTEVVEPAVWRLPLPQGEQLELVGVKGGDYAIGSAEDEEGRDVYGSLLPNCVGVDVEARRTVRLEGFVLVRHPITQAQWRAVVQVPGDETSGPLAESPGTFRADTLWERWGQPGALPVDSVSWNDARQWLIRLNGWLQAQWPEWRGETPTLAADPPRLALPSESQWEVACRAEHPADATGSPPRPFHFGATLDPTWANVDGNFTYGFGRQGIYRQRPVSIGFFGLVNRLGLADMHGQLQEWCGDQWHRNPVRDTPGKRGGWLGLGGKRRQEPPEPLDGSAWEGMDPGLADQPLERDSRLLRGGSWLHVPRNCRSAYRSLNLPDYRYFVRGFRVCCLPQDLLLYP